MAQKAWLNKFLPTWAWFVLLLICWGIASIVGKSLHHDADQVYRPPLATSAESPTGSDSSESTKLPEPNSDYTAPKNRGFDKYDCTLDCSGHRAGFDWAERKSISDSYDCDVAGDHYNSPLLSKTVFSVN